MSQVDKTVVFGPFCVVRTILLEEWSDFFNKHCLFKVEILLLDLRKKSTHKEWVDYAFSLLKIVQISLFCIIKKPVY